MRIAAEHADEWNSGGSPVQVAHKIGILREHCRAVGRDPAEIEVGVLLRTELEAESTYRSWVELGSPTVARARERFAAEGYRGRELEEEVRKSVYAQFLPVEEKRAAERPTTTTVSRASSSASSRTSARRSARQLRI